MFILVFIIVFGDLVYETRALCPASSFTNPDSGICYWYNPSLVTATACNTSCVLNGGIIGEIPDENSQLFLMQHFQSVGVTGGIWVGVNDIDAELNFRTWDGYPQSYFNWRLGQPNGYPLDAGATEQDCMAMFTTDNFRWQDKPCGNNYMCLCSYRSSSSCICNGGISALTQEQLDEVLKDLQVDKDSTNSAKRKLTSAKDDRPSAQAIGYVSIIVIGVTYSLPILLDVLRLCQKKKIADA